MDKRKFSATWQPYKIYNGCSLAAIAGGCNYLTVQAESDEEPGNRASRLVSAVLREESHLSRVADPTAGSYYLESLINQLAEKAWQKFVTRVAVMKPDFSKIKLSSSTVAGYD
jgi:hypothetical protein